MSDPIRPPRTNIFFDTEFVEDGSTIMPISAGFVKEDGSELYVEFYFDKKKATAHDFVRENVLPHLRGNATMRRNIRQLVLDFAGPNPLFWAWYADYDWVLMSQLWGSMMDLPGHWPKFCMDLRQSYEESPARTLPPKPEKVHDALEDARWNLKVYQHLYPNKRPRGGV